MVKKVRRGQHKQILIKEEGEADEQKLTQILNMSHTYSFENEIKKKQTIKEEPLINDCRTEKHFRQHKKLKVECERKPKGRRKKDEDEDYIPPTDSSDSEEDDLSTECPQSKFIDSHDSKLKISSESSIIFGGQMPVESCVDDFKTVKPYPNYLKFHSRDEKKIPDHKKCNKRKKYSVHQKALPVINRSIDLCKEFCDPTYVSNDNALPNDFDLDLTMSGCIKLSTLKKSKFSSNVNNRSNKMNKSDYDLINTSNKSKSSSIERKNFCRGVSSSSCKLDSKFINIDQDYSDSSSSFRETNMPFTNKENSQQLISNKAIAIKLEKESDFISSESKTTMVQNGFYFSAANNEMFSGIQIKQEPL